MLEIKTKHFVAGGRKCFDQKLIYSLICPQKMEKFHFWFNRKLTFILFYILLPVYTKIHYSPSCTYNFAKLKPF